MENIRMKKSVFNQGFTLLESVLSIFILSILSILILQMMFLITNHTDSYNDRQMILAIRDIKNSFIPSENINIQNNKLEIKNFNGEKISYIYKNNKIIKQKNDKGSEVILNNIKNIKFIVNNKLYYMIVDSLNEEREKKIYIGKKLFK